MTVVVGTIVLVSVALPYMVAFFVVMGWILWRMRERYIKIAREVKRFDGITRSPVYAMLSENIKGLSTIRAYGKAEDFQERFEEAVNLNGSWWTSFLALGRWFALRLDGLSALIMLFSTISAIFLSKNVGPCFRR